MKNLVGKVIQRIYYIFFLILGKLPVKKDVIVFESFLGKQYSDNPRAIYEFLNTHYPKYKMYWSVERKKTTELNTHPILILPRLSLKWVFIMARAKYWVTNSRLPLWIPKPEHTIYVQTWHGTPLKKLASDIEIIHMPDTDTSAYKKNFILEANKWDYLISPNKYSTSIFKKAFQFKKNIIETGYPRNDYLIKYMDDKKKISKIKEKCGILEDTKVILYAPTWRDNQFYKKGKYKFNLKLDLDMLKKHLGNEYVIVLRLHYLVAENLDLSNYKGFVYDHSKYEDIRDLYLISDILITDYSSVFFDYANLKRPIIFYAYDIADYRDNLRGFYFDIEEQAPGPIVNTTRELIREINKLEKGDPKDGTFYDKFYKKFCCLEDGRATERVVENLFLKQKE